MFANRKEAGRKLAMALAEYRGRAPVVLGLPRGGVVVAAEITRALGGDLDVVLVKKLRAPFNPELALGAIGEDGRCVLNNIPARADHLDREQTARLAEMAEQRRLYRAVRPRVDLAGRPVILVDDGLATGATMHAAVQVVQAARPESVLVAVPVGPPETVAELAQAAPVICLEQPAAFEGVGQFYRDFTQVSDREVVRILEDWA